MRDELMALKDNLPNETDEEETRDEIKALRQQLAKEKEACEKMFQESPLYLAIVVDQYSNTRELSWYMASKKMIAY